MSKLSKPPMAALLTRVEKSTQAMNGAETDLKKFRRESKCHLVLSGLSTYYDEVCVVENDQVKDFFKIYRKHLQKHGINSILCCSTQIVADNLIQLLSTSEHLKFDQIVERCRAIYSAFTSEEIDFDENDISIILQENNEDISKLLPNCNDRLNLAMLFNEKFDQHIAIPHNWNSVSDDLIKGSAHPSGRRVFLINESFPIYDYSEISHSRVNA